jgi:hypothetical protein
MSQPTGRRTVLMLLGGVAVSGCSAAGPPATTPTHTARPGSPAAPTPSRSVQAAPTVTLPRVHTWTPSTNDVVPACKLAAVRLVERRGNTASTAVEVIDAQYGGILTDSASVLVVCRSWRLSRGRLSTGGHSYDVRLSRGSATAWRVTAVSASRPGPRAAQLTRAARSVLDSDRIDLPPAARADVASGQVHDSVLAAMLGLSSTYRLGVSVVRSGHPVHVFGTNRLSDHPRGRAFDTWRINDRAVVDPDTPARLVTGYMHAVAGEGSYNVGGPYTLGSAPLYFSDETHHDHVHAGFPT